MKTKIIIPIIILSLVLITKSVFAENETATSTPKTVRNQVREEVKEERQEAKSTISQIREEKKVTIFVLKLKRSEVIYKAIKLALTKRHASLLKIKAKLDARIAKNPMNKNTTAATDKLKGFAAIETSYNIHLQIFDDKFEQIKSSTTKVSELISQLKIVANSVREDLNNMKSLLKEATVALAQAPKLEVTKTEE